MARGTDDALDDEEYVNQDTSSTDVGVNYPQPQPMAAGARAPMPVQSGTSGGAMDSLITDMLINRVDPGYPQPRPPVGAPTMPVTAEPLAPMEPPHVTWMREQQLREARQRDAQENQQRIAGEAQRFNPSAPPAADPAPRTGSANAAPVGRDIDPAPRTGSANAAPMAKPSGPMIRPGSYADIAYNALKNAFTSGPSAPVAYPSSATGRAGASAPASAPAPASAASSPSGRAAGVAAERSVPVPPSGADARALDRLAAWRASRGGGGAAPAASGDPNAALFPEGRSALGETINQLSKWWQKSPEINRKNTHVYLPGMGSGSAEAAGPKDTGTTGDELAARRQGNKVGPPNVMPYNAKPSTRYTKSNAPGGVNYKPGGGQRPTTKSRGSQAPQRTSRSAQAAPRTAQSGRSAYAQSLIDSMGPRGVGVTTYIEPATGNEILTGNGMYMNLGRTSTGTQKPSYTKSRDFFGQ